MDAGGNPDLESVRGNANTSKWVVGNVERDESQWGRPAIAIAPGGPTAAKFTSVGSDVRRGFQAGTADAPGDIQPVRSPPVRSPPVRSPPVRSARSVMSRMTTTPPRGMSPPAMGSPFAS